MLFALKDSGYALDADDVGVLRTGLGMDADGKVDFAEFMSVCEDFASSQVRSTDFAPIYPPHGDRQDKRLLD